MKTSAVVIVLLSFLSCNIMFAQRRCLTKDEGECFGVGVVKSLGKESSLIGEILLSSPGKELGISYGSTKVNGRSIGTFALGYEFYGEVQSASPFIGVGYAMNTNRTGKGIVASPGLSFKLLQATNVVVIPEIGVGIVYFLDAHAAKNFTSAAHEGVHIGTYIFGRKMLLFSIAATQSDNENSGLLGLGILFN